MEKQGRIVADKVPWLNKAEFEDVYKSLYSSDLIKKRVAVEKITMWESRCHPTLPMSVDATAALVRAQLQDQMYQLNCESPCLPGDIRLLYCTALIRFVNVLSEIAQPPDHSTPVRMAAFKVGIPEWIVDLRHKSTHSVLPNLEILRKGAVFALEWLNKEYWEQQLESFVDFVCPKNETLKKQCEYAIACFQSFQLNIIKDEPRPVKERKPLKKVKLSILLEIAKCLKKNPKLFINTLLSPGFFFHSENDLTLILTSKYGNDTDCDIEFFIKKKTVNLPQSLLEFWAPVLKVLFKTNHIPEFVEALLKCQSLPDKLHQKIAVAWALTLIQIDRNNYACFGIKSEEAEPNFNWLRMLYICSRYPCTYSPALLPILAENVYPPMDMVSRNQIMAMVAIKIGATIPKEEGRRAKKNREVAEHRKFTVERLKTEMKLEQLDGPYGWEVAENKFEGIDWSKLPLGYEFPKSNISSEETSTVEESANLNSSEVVKTEPEDISTNVTVECVQEMDAIETSTIKRPEFKETYDPEKIVTLLPTFV